MRSSDINYELPSELIAQYPQDKRDESRLLILDRSAETIREDIFLNLPDCLDKGDCLVMNDTRVVRARLRARKSTGGRVEIFLLRETEPGRWEALVRPSSRLKPGARVEVGSGESVVGASVEDRLEGGLRVVRFDDVKVLELMEETGEVPLPPYIHRDSHDPRDADRYQTVFARAPGAVAAPTAGLHFTESVFESLLKSGVNTAFLTLHVGYGTFKPIQSENLADHRVDPEDFVLPEATAALLNEARARNRRVVATGTTCARVLESRCTGGAFRAGEGATDLYIYPPYEFTGVDALLTNFHLPKSSLLALVCAFAGTDFVLDAYRRAVEKKFRFYSYGDAMLIL